MSLKKAFSLPLVLLPLIVCSLLFGACNIINPAEAVPTYVHIDSFSFGGDPTLTGSNSHKITAVYAFFNNHSIGVFNMPVTFPVIADAQGTLTLYPAIDANGLSGVEVEYPFYTLDTSQLVPHPGTTVNYLPRAQYQPGTVSQYFEGFEYNATTSSFRYVGGADSLKPDGSPANVFEGTRSGHIHLPAANDTSVSGSTKDFTVPSDKESYIELDYKSTIPLQIGMSSLLNSGLGIASSYLIGLNPRSTWGKIYIPLRSFAATYQGSAYNVLIRAQVPAGQAGGDVYIDNVKVVSF